MALPQGPVAQPPRLGLGALLTGRVGPAGGIASSRCGRRRKIPRMKRRIANLPLHGGKAPAWLFKRMARLAGAVTVSVSRKGAVADMPQVLEEARALGRRCAEMARGR